MQLRTWKMFHQWISWLSSSVAWSAPPNPTSVSFSSVCIIFYTSLRSPPLSTQYRVLFMWHELQCLKFWSFLVFNFVGHSDPGILFFSFLLRCFNFSVCIFCFVVEVIEEKEKKEKSFCFCGFSCEVGFGFCLFIELGIWEESKGNLLHGGNFKRESDCWGFCAFSYIEMQCLENAQLEISFIKLLCARFVSSSRFWQSLTAVFKFEFKDDNVTW